MDAGAAGGRQTSEVSLPTDKRAIQMFGRQEFRPVIDGITIGLQVLLLVHRHPDTRVSAESA